MEYVILVFVPLLKCWIKYKLSLDFFFLLKSTSNKVKNKRVRRCTNYDSLTDFIG